MPRKTNELGDLIRTTREARGLSQAALGREIGVPNSTIIRLEDGSIAAPDPAKLQRLAEVLEIEVEELMVRHPAVAGGLPGFGTYLRAKYGMSDAAVAEAEQFFAELEAREKPKKGGRRGKSGH